MIREISVCFLLTAFAARVDLLLSAYEKEANGKIHVVRHNTPSDANANAALEDGMRAFNRERGDVCYLGLAVTGNDKKETLPQLSAEWEQALESDLSRAIERVAGSEAKQQPTPKAPSGADTTALESVKQAIPNFATLSLEEGTRILREAAIKDFKTAADEMETRAKIIEQASARANRVVFVFTP